MLIQQLKKYFGFNSFLVGQEEVIRKVLDRQSAAAIFPTGAGKSLCYQLPAMLLPGMTLIVACLMVSRVRYPHFFNQLVRRRHTFQYLVKLIFAIVIVFSVKELAIPIIFFYFVMASPLRALWSQVVLRRVLNRPASISS